MAKGASKTGAQPGFLVAREMLLPEEQRILSDEWAGRIIDFDTDDTLGALIASGYDPSRVTFFIWEGVTQHVTEPGILATPRFLSGSPMGSKLAFTYVVREEAGIDVEGGV